MSLYRPSKETLILKKKIPVESNNPNIPAIPKKRHNVFKLCSAVDLQSFVVKVAKIFRPAILLQACND